MGITDSVLGGDLQVTNGSSGHVGVVVQGDRHGELFEALDEYQPFLARRTECGTRSALVGRWPYGGGQRSRAFRIAPTRLPVLTPADALHPPGMLNPSGVSHPDVIAASRATLYADVTNEFVSARSRCLPHRPAPMAT